MTTAAASQVRRPVLSRMGKLTAIPPAFALNWLLQLNFSVSEEDYPRNLFGSPLPWHADSIATSPDSQIYLAPLVIDLAIYLALSWLLVRLWRRMRFAQTGIAGAVVCSLAWAAGLYGLAGICGLALLDGQLQPWYDSFAPMVFERVSLLAH